MPTEAENRDRQRKLDEVCRRILRDFVGQDLTPTLIAEAEGRMRQALGEAITAGTYVLPDGLLLDRVALGDDMRIKVYFKRPATRFDRIADELDDNETAESCPVKPR